MRASYIKSRISAWAIALLVLCTPALGIGKPHIESMYSIIDVLAMDSKSLRAYLDDHEIKLKHLASCSYSALYELEKYVLLDKTVVGLEYFLSRRKKDDFSFSVLIKDSPNCITPKDITGKYNLTFHGKNLGNKEYELLHETMDPSYSHLHFMFLGEPKQCLRAVELKTSDENSCKFQNGLHRAY